MNADILIVDDTLENLQLLIGILSAQGYEVRAFAEGKFALESALENPPDLILLDVCMPGMDGYTLCEHLKADSRTCGVPVIFISAYADRDAKIRGFRVGGIDYITKPFYEEEILARVRTQLNLYHSHKQLEEKNTQLEEANARLELKNNELKDLASTVSHDLKAPLRAIGNLVRWFLEDYTDTFDEKGREMIAMLVDRVTHIESLISGILQYSKAGHIDGQQERIDLNLLVKDVLGILEAPSHLRVFIEGELPCITGETTSIRQIFQNLLVNAMTYTDKAEGKIRIRAVQEGRGWTFRIADNGPGIAKQYHEKIFSMFQSVDLGETHESSGIGLAIVKKIVEQYGGRIWLESNPGKGSEFFFTLPGNKEL